MGNSLTKSYVIESFILWILSSKVVVQAFAFSSQAITRVVILSAPIQSRVVYWNENGVVASFSLHFSLCLRCFYASPAKHLHDEKLGERDLDFEVYDSRCMYCWYLRYHKDDLKSVPLSMFSMYRSSRLPHLSTKLQLNSQHSSSTSRLR